MKKLLLLFPCLLLIGCAELNPTTSEETKQNSLYISDNSKEEPKKDIKKIKIDFEKEMTDKSCNKDLWLKYKWGNIFQTEANNAKITPFDIIDGDPYTTRNIESNLLSALRDGFINYVSVNFTPAEYEMFSATKSGSQSRKSVFNQVVKKDYNCYNKLK